MKIFSSVLLILFVFVASSITMSVRVFAGDSAATAMVPKPEALKKSIETKPVAGNSETKGRKYPDGTPTRAVQDLDDLLDKFIVKKRGIAITAEEESKNRELKRSILHGTFDIAELGRLSLAKNWDARSQAERDQFVQLLKDLLEEKAIFSKEQSAAKSKNGGKYFVVYRGQKYEDETKSRAFVKTKVVVPSENVEIELNYRMKKAASGWKIYDIVVDEASIVDNYRYQFDSIIQKHGYADLIRRMQEKLAEIRAKRS